MEVVVRAAVVFVFLVVITRAIGRRELAQMNAFDLVLLVIMGDLVQQAITSDDRSITSAFLAIGTIAVLILTMSYATFRWKRLRDLIDGTPSIVVRDGDVLHEVLRLERVPLDDVLEAARSKGIERVSDIKLGILEADGTFSFIQRD